MKITLDYGTFSSVLEKVLKTKGLLLVRTSFLVKCYSFKVTFNIQKCREYLYDEQQVNEMFSSILDV